MNTKQFVKFLVTQDGGIISPVKTCHIALTASTEHKNTFTAALSPIEFFLSD